MKSEGEAARVAHKAVRASVAYMRSMGPSALGPLAAELERLVERAADNIAYERVAYCFDRFLEAELDFETRGDRGIGRVSTHYPRLGAYLRRGFRKVGPSALNQLRQHLRDNMWCAYYAYILLEGEESLPPRDLTAEALFEEWVPSIYSSHAFASEDHKVVTRAVTMKASSDIVAWMKRHRVTGGGLFKEDRTGELVVRYLAAAGILRAIEVGQWETETHEYSDSGSKTTKPEVRDTGGLTDTATRSVTVDGGGLADSPWPKFHQNNPNTGVSPYLGAQTPALKWTYATRSGVYSSAAIGSDGTIYVGSDDGYLYAINPDGTLTWTYQAATNNSVQSSPAIDSVGTVYVGSCDGHLYAINPDGTLKWRYETGDSVWSSPAIGADGTIYVGSNDYYLYAIGP